MNFQSLLRLGSCLAIAVIICNHSGVNGERLAKIVKPPLRIGSFNIQILGQAKFKKEEVVENLVKIIHRYDVLLIQEIRDSTQKVIYQLLDRINSGLKSSEQYDMTLSERLGRSSSKEQYAYLWRMSKASLDTAYVYNDEQNDVFEREPYVAIFESHLTAISKFAMIGCHIKPSDAINELNKMELVYDDLVRRYNMKDAIFAGDFNADCGYVGKTKWDEVDFRKDDRFLWLISDDADTTVAHSSCAYDRFVIAGEGLARAYSPGSADVYYYDSALGLNEELAKDVSDHYPIEMDLMAAFPWCPKRKSTDILDDLLAEIEKEEEMELLMNMIRSGDGL